MITYDASNALSGRELARALSRARPALLRVLRKRSSGGFGFAHLPNDRNGAEVIESYVRRSQGRFRTLVHLGIGGSALGAMALCDAFPPAKGTPEILILDNIDPEESSDLFNRLDPRSTLFHVVTKSGTTTETIASFLTALDRTRTKLGAGWRDHFVVTTDPKKGFLRKWASKERVTAFAIPSDVGGRFSVLSPVGLLPAAFRGIEIREVLAGAAEMDQRCSREEDNPAFTAAVVAHELHRRGRSIHVLMPYARALRTFADWYLQLWAESLGKDGKGPTPVRALGATDQHSQIQLYQEGPQDKFITFVEVEKFRRSLKIPQGPRVPDFPRVGSFEALLSASKKGTEEALTRNGRPNATIRIDEITPRAMGGLFYFFEMMTVFAGALYGVDPFTQPGVEAGKRATRKHCSGC